MKYLQAFLSGSWKEAKKSTDSYAEVPAEPSKPVLQVLKGTDNGRIDEISKLNLKDFRLRNFAIKIYSEVLGENFWLVSNETTRDHLNSEGLVIYLAEEITFLKENSPELLRKIHGTKKVFKKSRVVD